MTNTSHPPEKSICFNSFLLLDDDDEDDEDESSETDADFYKSELKPSFLPYQGLL